MPSPITFPINPPTPSEQRTRSFIRALGRIHAITQNSIHHTTLHDGCIRAHNAKGENIASMSVECLEQYSK